MEIGGSAVHFAKRIAKLEAQCDQLKNEKISLKEQLRDAKGKEEEMIEECAKVKDKYLKVKAEFGSEKSKWREEEENLREICWQVGVEKKKLEIDLKAAKQRVANSCVEVAQKLMDKDRHFQSLLEENNSRLDMAFEARMAKVKEEFDSKERRWREEEEKIREECRQLGVEKRKLELDLGAAKRGIENGGDGVAKKLKAAEAEAEGLKSLLEEKDGLIITLLAKNENLERHSRRFEMDFHAKMAMEAKKQKVEEKKILELTQKIEVLEGEKGQIEAEYCKLKEDNMSEAERIFSGNKALETETKRGKTTREKITGLVKRIGVLERVKEAEKMAMEEEGKQKVLGLTHRIEVLERGKREIEAKFRLVNREKSEEIERILNEKAAVEVEKKVVEAESKKKVLELVERIEVLEREKNEMEAKVCQAEQEKSEEIQRILNEKRAVKEDYEKKILELVDRNDILEREKRVFEAEMAERDEVTKVLGQENICLKDKKKELEMEINGLASKSMEDVQLSQHACLTNNVVTLSTCRPNEGQNSAGVILSSEHNGSINHDVENSDGQYEDETTHTNACKRKRTIGKWEEPGRTYGSNGGDVQVVSGNIAFEWEVDQDVLDAFDAHPELCLKAVCALYRQHQRLGDSKNTSLSSEGIALAEYLISEDPEGRKTKKMVAKLDKFDRDAVGECINIAKQHYKQLFEIYKNKEDQVFLS